MPLKKGEEMQAVRQEKHWEETQIYSGPFYQVQSTEKLSEYMN